MSFIKPSISSKLLFLQLLVLSMFLPACGIFSPDDWTDNQIAYRADDASIYLMCLDTGATKKIVEPAWGKLRWSPDGKRLAYVGPDNWEEQGWIYIIDISGDNKRILRYWQDNGRIEPHPDGGRNPVWSPNREEVAFSSHTDWGSNQEIYIIELDTTNGVNETRVTANPYDDSLADWSPDGTRLLCKSDFSVDSTFDDYGDIYTITTDGLNRHRILELDESFSGAGFRYSPDGNRIAFIGGDNTEIYIMNADGSNISRITDNELHEVSLSWSPDGNQLLFVAGSYNDGGHIYSINIDGNRLKQITKGEAKYYNAEWRPY